MRLLHGDLLDALHRLSLRITEKAECACFLTCTARPENLAIWSSCHPRALAECGPIAHEVTALFEKIAASIGGFDGIADGVGEGLLYDVVRVGGRFGGPISKRAAKAMDRHIASLHLLQHIRHSHVA